MCAEVRLAGRPRLPELRCLMEGGRASVELRTDRGVRGLVAGYGRLLFRRGRGWSASLKLLSVESRHAAGAHRLSIKIQPRGVVGIVRDFYGIMCAPTVKVDMAGRLDAWLMLLAPGGASSIGLSKQILTADKAPVQASLYADGEVLRLSLSAYGSGFRRAALYLHRRIDTGLSLSHGLERIAVAEKLAEASPGSAVHTEWRPARGPQEPLLFTTSSLPSVRDVTTLLQALGVRVERSFLLGPRLAAPFVAWDGEAATYALKLKLDRRTVDEALMKLHSPPPP